MCDKPIGNMVHLWIKTEKFWDMIQDRNIRVLGHDNMNKIRHTNIVIAGLGGVGATLAELCVRSGFQNIIISDNTKYEPSNINRQIGATASTIGASKALVMHQRLLDIDPTSHVIALSKNIWELKFLFLPNIKVVANCVDKVGPQIQLAKFSRSLGAYMIIGGVIENGTKGIITSFDPDGIKYEDLVIDQGIIELAEDIDIYFKRRWLQLNKAGLPQEVLNKYKRNPREPYPVLTALPHIIAGIMLQEIIKIILRNFEPVIAPKAIIYDGWTSNAVIVNLKEEKRENALMYPVKEVVPWRP
jgi:molybdopterin/thiamine biosynthesis adenylyltransferase